MRVAAEWPTAMLRCCDAAMLRYYINDKIIKFEFPATFTWIERYSALSVATWHIFLAGTSFSALAPAIHAFHILFAV